MRLHEASGGAVKLVTVAPEEEGGLEFVKRVSPVCTVSVGHTEAGLRHGHACLRGRREPRYAPLQRYARPAP